MADKNDKLKIAEKEVTQSLLKRGTLVSRMINPELFIRPNKIVMSIGLILLTGCVVCLAYMDSGQTPVQRRGKTLTTETNKSKWD